MALLTPLIKQQTSVPAPGISLAEDGSTTQTPSDSRTVGVSICSEFMPYSAPVNIISSNGNIELVQDQNGQPMIFALSGKQRRLLCLVHINGGPIASQSFDISPGGGTRNVNAFDICQGPNGVLYMAASIIQNDQTCDVYYATIPLPDITWDLTNNKVIGFDASKVPWTKVPNNIGRKNVTVLSVSPLDPSGFHLVAGNQATATTTATTYAIDSTDIQTPWSVIPLPEDGAIIREIGAGTLNNDPGVFSLFSLPNDVPNTPTACVFDGFSSKLSYLINQKPIGVAQGIYPNIIPFNGTDLFVAASKGIGFYNFMSINDPQQMILPDINFKQVVSAAAVQSLDNSSQTHLTIFAVSEHDELYYIEGTRQVSINVVQFQASGIPIRTNVDKISAQYNKKVNASEIFYVGNGLNEIRHLWKDPVTMLWQEDNVSVKSTGNIESYPAYHTTIKFTDNFGQPLSYYPFSLTSSWRYVLVSDRTHQLDTTPTAFSTDSSGACSIVARADDTLGAAQYKVLLTEFTSPGNPVSIAAEPTQRVLRLLANVHSGKDIQGAQSTAGVSVFKGSKATSDDFEAAASVAKSLPATLRAVDPSTADSVLGPSLNAVADGQLFAWAMDALGVVTLSDGLWADGGAIDVAESFLSDIVEGYTALITLEIKVALKILGPVIILYLEIEGKIWSFILKEVGPLLKSLMWILKITLGIDITGFLDWLGFVFDMDNIKKTQKVLVDVFKASMNTCGQFYSVNQPVMQDLFNVLRAKASTFIKDNRSPVDNCVTEILTSQLSGILDFIFDNPVLSMITKYSPIAIFEGAIADEIGDDIQLPDATEIMTLLTGTLGKLLDQEADNILRWVEDLVNTISAVFNGIESFSIAFQNMLGDTFWAMFNALAEILLALLGITKDIMKGSLTMMETVWKIPLISDLWNDFADQDMPLINLLTLPAATALNLY